MVSSGAVMNSGNAVCRNHPGTKNEDFYNWAPQKFEEMDSTLAVQQYIQQMIRQNFKDVDAILTAPLGQDEGVWKYEQLRQFCLELNGLAVRLQSECTPETCSQMTATEQWIFLCAGHKTPKECPAIDYTRHTLDGAASMLNSNKNFASRVNIKASSVAKLGSVCRRVYRIFSHAYYHHRHIFDEAENETYLCRRFTSFVIKYNLMSQDNLIVPILCEDPVEDRPDPDSNQNKMTGMSIAKKPSNSPSGITSFLDLPEGVVPDAEPDIKFDENFPDVLDDDSSFDVEDEFAYADESNYATLKPAKEGSRSAREEEVKDTPEEEKEEPEAPLFVTSAEEDNELDKTLQTTSGENPKDQGEENSTVIEATDS